MRSNVLIHALLVLTAPLWLACATNRSEIAVDVPGAGTSYPETKATPVFIAAVTDERTFEDAPSSPDVPSIGFGGLDKNHDDIRSRAVARKRNTFGKALGDVLLQPGQTVNGLVKENLAQGLRRAGYKVVDKADDKTLVLKVHIKKFWSWMNPGMWQITLSNVLETTIDRSSGPAKTISIKVDDGRQMATESAWAEIVVSGLTKYQEEASHLILENPAVN